MSKKDFTINDIQTGDIVVTKNRGNAIAIAGRLKTTDNMFSEYGLGDLKDYSNNLKAKDRGINEYDIEKVYKIINCYDYSLEEIIDELPKGKVKLIWERKREIDWTKVPRFTKVQVQDCGDKKWENKYYIGYDEEMPYPYRVTSCDQFTYKTDAKEEAWENIRIYDESDIKEEWYKQEICACVV